MPNTVGPDPFDAFFDALLTSAERREFLKIIGDFSIKGDCNWRGGGLVVCGIVQLGFSLDLVIRLVWTQKFF